MITAAPALSSQCRILGVDPGSNCTGAALLVWNAGRPKLDRVAVIRVKGSVAERLQRLFEELSDLLQQLKPDEVAFEKVFTAYNPQSALKLGQARGVLILAAALSAVPLFEYSATRVKLATIGYGRASKEEVQRMVQIQFRLAEPLPADAADAAAIAMTHGILRENPQIREESRL